MDHQERMQLTLAVMPAVEPLTGSLALHGEAPREFSGVLELLALVERARRGAAWSDETGRQSRRATSVDTTVPSPRRATSRNV